MTFIQTKINILTDLINPASYMGADIVQLMQTELKLLEGELNRLHLKSVVDELILGFIEGAMTTDGTPDIPTTNLH